jgi:hypothetical protein
MANLTIALDEQLLREARIKAVQQGTSVNEICRQAVERFARGDAAQQQQRVERLQRLLANAAKATPQGTGPAWPGRAAFYDEVLRERGLLQDAVTHTAEDAATDEAEAPGDKRRPAR